MKRLLSLLLLLSVLTGFSGCSLLQEFVQEPELQYETPYLGFAQRVGEEFSMEDYLRMTPEQVTLHQGEWKQYGVDVYYSGLDATAQNIYRILCYAMNTSQPYILIDDRLLEGTAFSLQDILNALALDNPMVEQNLEWKHADFTSTLTHSRLFSPPVVEQLAGQSLYISDFTPEKREKKQKALEKARSILEALPQTAEPEQRAQDIYTYLGEHVQYFNTEVDRESVDYLYDALCIGRSNCDGFANAFSLLCSLSGIRCCEKLSEAREEDGEGHTWNAVELNGIWYNVDATASDEVKQRPTLRLHFGFADDRQDPGVWRAELCPPCDRELFPYDCTLSTEQGAGKVLRSALKQTDRDYLIVCVQSGELSDGAMQDIANTTRHDITSYCTQTRSGAAVHYIYFH